MAAPPLLKVPMLFFASYCTYLYSKSPQPPPKNAETVAFDKVEKKATRRLFGFGAPVLRFINITTFLGEAAIVIAENYPSYPQSRYIRLIFLRDASASSIHISLTFLVGFMLLVGGTYLRYTCYQYLGRFFTFQLALRDDHKLITSGPYSIVRHPAYTGLIAAIIGTGLIHLGPGSWWYCLGVWHGPFGLAWVVAWLGLRSFFSVTLAMRTNTEDKVLKKSFGKEWEAWAKKTPYKLVPGIF